MSHHQNPARVLCCLITSLSFIIIAPTLWITLALKLPSDSSVSDTMEMTDSSNRTIYLLANVIAADIVHATTVMEWTIFQDTCFRVDNNCTEVNIFFESHLSPSDPAYNNGHTPIYILNQTFFELGSDSFRTELDLSSAADASYLSGYPFDTYNTAIVAYAQDVSTNNPVSVALINGIGLIITSKLSGIETTTVAAELIYKDQPVFLQGSMVVTVHLQRSTMVIMYCIIITATFWMVTLAICLVMIATVLFRFRQRNEIVVVPIGTVFAFTQLRASMPGAPEGFGDIIDFVGLLPCLILLSISAVTMVIIYLFINPDDPSRRAFTWGELKYAWNHYIHWRTAKEWIHHAKFRIMTARQTQRASDNLEIPLINSAHEMGLELRYGTGACEAQGSSVGEPCSGIGVVGTAQNASDKC